MTHPIICSTAVSAGAVCYVIGAAAAGAAENPRQSYDIARGDAVVTLKLFADGSGREVVYLVDTVRGVVTNPVKGNFTAPEVIDRLLRNTVLVVVKDEKTGALLIQRIRSGEQIAPPSTHAPSENENQTKTIMKSPCPPAWPPPSSHLRLPQPRRKPSPPRPTSIRKKRTPSCSRPSRSARTRTSASSPRVRWPAAAWQPT